MHHSIPQEYRLPLFGEWDGQFKKFLSASVGLGILVVLVVLLAPARNALITEVAEIPERFAKLILKEPKAEITKDTAASSQALPEIESEPPPPPPPPKVRRQKPPVAPDAGQAGRVKAQKEVSKSLAGATQAAESAIQNLSASLGKTATKTAKQPTRSRRRSVSSGRGSSDLTKVQHGSGGSGVSADVAGSSVTGSLLSIESVSHVTEGGEPGGTGTEAGGGGASGAYRSNASLLAVVRKYAPGIQFCYDNELKRSPGLRGKVVAALTVAASGEVTGVKIVSDTVNSSGLQGCILAQIHEWKFPAISGGSTVFKTPFVFTPPKN
jgi:outer membrane biosynthesis protein TonB